MLFIDNRSSTIHEVVNRYLEWSENADIAVAFIRKSGIRLVDSNIKSLLRRGGGLRMLVGKDFGYTEPDAILYLNFIGAHVRVFIGDTIFHPKCYIFRKSNNFKIVLGSSNFTASCFNTGVEWNLALDENENNLRNVFDAFQKIWESDYVVDISDDVIEEMQRHHNKTLSKDKTILGKLDLNPNIIEFNFEVNPSFLSNRYYRLITIPGEYNKLLSKYVHSTNRKARIITPGNRKVSGRIHHSTSSWSPYYQIRSSKKVMKRSRIRWKLGNV